MGEANNRNEINEKTDIIMRYEVIKTGRSITSIKFFAEKKKEEI